MIYKYSISNFPFTTWHVAQDLMNVVDKPRPLVNLNKEKFESFVLYCLSFIFLKVCLGRSDRESVKM